MFSDPSWNDNRQKSQWGPKKKILLGRLWDFEGSHHQNRSSPPLWTDVLHPETALGRDRVGAVPAVVFTVVVERHGVTTVAATIWRDILSREIPPVQLLLDAHQVPGVGAEILNVV